LALFKDFFLKHPIDGFENIKMFTMKGRLVSLKQKYVNIAIINAFKVIDSIMEFYYI